MTTQLKIELVVDDKGTAKITGFAGSVQTEMKKAESHVKSFSDQTRNALQVLAGFFAGGAVLSGIRSVTTAFMEQERAVNKMSSAMKNQGDFSRAGLKDLEDYASQLQEITTVGDEAALGIMANMKTYGMLNEEVKRAAQSAIDFASAKREEGMTIEQASELIGKAYMGQTDRLKRYGIVIDENLKGSAKFEAVLKQLNERFGGAAAAELETYEGAWKKLGNTWGEVKEDLGAIILDLGETLRPALTSTIGLLKEATAYWKDFLSVNAKSTLQKRQQEILSELGRLEAKYPNQNPNYFGRDIPRFPEDAARLYERLNRELQTVTRSIQGFQAEEEKVLAGGRRTVVEDYEAQKKALAEYEKLMKKREELESQARQKMFEAEGGSYDTPTEKQILAMAERSADLERKAFEDRLKLYIKMGEEEEKVWKAETRNYKAELDKQTEFSKQAARNMQDAMSDFFLDAMRGDLQGFSDYWGSFWDSMKRVFANSLSEIALEWGSSQLKGIITGSGSNSLMGMLGGVVSGASGWIGDTAGSALDSILDLFHVGGLVGDRGERAFGNLKSDEVLAVLQKGEYVLPRDLVSALGLSGPGIAGEGLTGPAVASQAAISAVIGAVASLALGGIPGAVAALALGSLGYGSSKGSFILGLMADLGLAPSVDTLGMAFGQIGPMSGGLEAYGPEGPGPAGSIGGAFGLGGFGTYATGGIVPRDQIAKVHGGEGVFTPEQMRHLSPSGGRPMTIIVNVAGSEFFAEVRQIADEVRVQAARRGLTTERVYS